jgi:hypothetical protein
MEYVAGADLATFVKLVGPLPIADALRCTLQVAAGLAYAHQQGVTHRDIKPGNLLLNPQGLVKILDLGLARMRSDSSGDAASLSATGAVVGTIDFMPPEQAINAKAADERSDIYSLGCTLFYLLAGKPLYERETLMQKLLAHREAPIPDVRDFVPSASPQLAATLSRMLAKDPADRFATMSQAAESLRECLRESDAEQDLMVRAAALLDGIAPRATSSQETQDYVIERSLMATHIVPQPGATLAHPAQQPPPDSPWRRFGRRWLLAVLAVVLLGAAVVIRIQFADGTLVIQVTEPGAQIHVDGEQVATVTSTDGQRVYRIGVEPGPHRVHVTTERALLRSQRESGRGQRPSVGHESPRPSQIENPKSKIENPLPITLP